MGHAVQREVDRVRVAAEVVVGFVQHDIGMVGQVPGGGQARNAGADHRDAAPCAGHCRPLLALPRVDLRDKEGAVQRPETNEGGREEEEMGLRVSLRTSERLHGAKRWVFNGAAQPAACTANTLDLDFGRSVDFWSPERKKGSAKQAAAASSGMSIGLKVVK